MADRHSENAPDRVRGEVNRHAVVEMRAAGHSFAEIGDQLGISPQAAHQHLKRALKVHRAGTEEQVAKLRAIEAARLTALSDAIWERAMAGQLGAIDRILRIRESYRKLLGLDVEKGRGDDEIRTFVVDLRMPDQQGQVVEGEVVEIEVTPRLGIGDG